MKKLDTNVCLAVTAALFITLSSGCSTFMPSSFNREIPAAATSQVGSSNGGYTVVMDANMKKIRPYEGAISRDQNNPTTVQIALNESGARKHFRAMEIDVVRMTESGQQLKMPVDYETRKKAVRMEQDYTLHPGDTIMIRPKASGPMEKILGAVTGG